MPGMTRRWQEEKQQLASASKVKEELEKARFDLEQAQRKGLALGIPAAWMAFEQAQRADGVGVGGVFRLFKRHGDMTLRGQIINFIRLNFLNCVNQA